jgi:hypothetical protein
VESRVGHSDNVVVGMQHAISCPPWLKPLPRASCLSHATGRSRSRPSTTRRPPMMRSLCSSRSGTETHRQVHLGPTQYTGPHLLGLNDGSGNSCPEQEQLLDKGYGGDSIGTRKAAWEGTAISRDLNMLWHRGHAGHVDTLLCLSPSCRRTPSTACACWTGLSTTDLMASMSAWSLR